MSLSRYVPVRKMAILINNIFMSPMMQFCFNTIIVILSGQSGCLVELYVSQKFRAGLFPFPSWSLGSCPFNFTSTCGCSLSLFSNRGSAQPSHQKIIQGPHHPPSAISQNKFLIHFAREINFILGTLGSASRPTTWVEALHYICRNSTSKTMWVYVRSFSRH
jgi:hypothetical protein